MSETSSSLKRPRIYGQGTPVRKKQDKKQGTGSTENENELPFPFRKLDAIVEDVITMNVHALQSELPYLILDACEDNLVNHVFNKETEAWNTSNIRYNSREGNHARDKWRTTLINRIVFWQDQYNWVANELEDLDKDELAILMTKSQALLEHNSVTSLKNSEDKFTSSRGPTVEEKFGTLEQAIEELKPKPGDEVPSDELAKQRAKLRTERAAYRQFKYIMETLKANNVSLAPRIDAYLEKCRALDFDRPHPEAQPALLKLGKIISGEGTRLKKTEFVPNLNRSAAELAKHYGDIGKSTASATRMRVFIDNCKAKSFDVSRIIADGETIAREQEKHINDYFETLGPDDQIALTKLRERYTELSASLDEATTAIAVNASPLVEVEKETKKKFGRKCVAYLRLQQQGH